MKRSPLLIAVIAFSGSIAVPSNAGAFECPKHFKQAESAIEKVMDDMKDMKKMMPKEQMALVHSLLDDAKMRLTGARHNHNKPQGAYDHARAIAKADAARAYAVAADIFHWALMKK